jgi:sugar lactone lactonase YvrE
MEVFRAINQKNKRPNAAIHNLLFFGNSPRRPDGAHVDRRGSSFFYDQAGDVTRSSIDGVTTSVTRFDQQLCSAVRTFGWISDGHP